MMAKFLILLLDTLQCAYALMVVTIFGSSLRIMWFVIL